MKAWAVRYDLGPISDGGAFARTLALAFQQTIDSDADTEALTPDPTAEATGNQPLMRFRVEASSEFRAREIADRVRDKALIKATTEPAAESIGWTISQDIVEIAD